MTKSSILCLDLICLYLFDFNRIEFNFLIFLFNFLQQCDWTLQLFQIIKSLPRAIIRDRDNSELNKLQIEQEF